MELNPNDLAELEQTVRELAAKIGVPQEILPVFAEGGGTSYARIEHDSEGFQVIHLDEGREVLRETIGDGEETLYWIFAGATFFMASDHAEKLDAPRGDWSILTKKQQELLAQLDPAWRDRNADEYLANMLRNLSHVFPEEKRHPSIPPDVVSFPPLHALEQVVLAYASRIGVPANDLPTFGSSRDGGYPHIEHTAGAFHFAVVERGQELERRVTRDADEILYWVFESATFSMACSYELKHRVPEEDCRILMFEKQETLLGQLNPAWREREADKHREILAHHPFSDG